MLRQLAHFTRPAVLPSALVFLALLVTGCWCTGVSEYRHNVDYGGAGGPPVVHGRVRFDSGNTVHIDLQSLESGVPRAGYMEVYWTSHSGGPPPLWPATPNVTFSGTPSSEWDIYGIEATFDPTKTDFYVKVGMKQTSSSTTYMTNSPSTQHWTISATSWDNIDQP